MKRVRRQDRIDAAALAGEVRDNLAGIAQAQVATQTANQIALDAAITDLRAAPAYRSTAPRPPVTDTFTAAQGWATGTADGQRGYTLQAATGTAAVNAATGRLAVNADVTSGGSAGLVTPYALHEGIFRQYIAADADPAPVLMWGGDATALGPKYAIWRDGANLQAGWWTLNAAGAVQDVTPQQVVPIPTGDYWIEVLLTLRAYVVRVWPATTDRATAAVRVVGFDNEAPPVPPGGALRLASIGAGGAVYGPTVVDSYDRQPNPLSAKAEPVGAWFPVVEGQVNALATITSGAELRSRVSGTSGLGLNLLIPEGMSYRPVIAWRAREVGTLAWPEWQRYQVPSNNAAGDLIRVDPVTGLAPAKTYDVHLCFNVQESDPLYRRRAGVIVQDVLVGAGGAIRALREPQRLRIKFVGDSITAGIVALGHAASPNPASTTAVLASEWSWPHVACELLGAIPLHNGYGGAGVTVPGEGGMPVARVNASTTMFGRPGKSFYPGVPHGVVINYGENDDGAQYRNPPARPSSAVFSADYRALCLSELALNPGALVICMRPFNGGFWSEIQRVAAELGLPTIDTTGWLTLAAGDYASNDQTHPLGFPANIDNGHRKAGRLTAAAFTAMGMVGTLEPVREDAEPTVVTPPDASGGTPPMTPPADEAQFATYTPGTVDGQQDWRVRFGGTGTITGGSLRVDAEVGSIPGGLTWERSHTGTRHTVLVRGSSEKRFMYKWRMNLSNGQAYAVWCANSTQIEHGHVANVSGGMAIPNYQNGPAVPAGDYYMEVQEGAGFPAAGSTLEIRTWAASGSRPSSPSYTYTFSAAGPAYAQGTVALNSIGAPAVIGSIVIA